MSWADKEKDLGADADAVKDNFDMGRSDRKTFLKFDECFFSAENTPLFHIGLSLVVGICLGREDLPQRLIALFMRAHPSPPCQSNSLLRATDESPTTQLSASMGNTSKSVSIFADSLCIG